MRYYLPSSVLLYYCLILLPPSSCFTFTTNIYHYHQQHHSPPHVGTHPHPTLQYVSSSSTCRRKGTIRYANFWKDKSTSDLSESSSSSSTTTSTTPKLFSLSMIFLPFISIIFDNLLQVARSLPPNSSEQLIVVTMLFISNRIYLYTMAATIVGLAACRGATDPPQLGKRITDLTEELLYRPTLQQQERNDNQSATTVLEEEPPTSVRPSLIQSLTDSGLEQSLDEVSTETKALLLPLLVSFCLALSVFLLPFWSGTPSFMSTDERGSAIQDFISQVLPTITQVWNVGLLVLFTRSEIRRLGYELKWIPDSVVFEWIVALGITGIACFGQIWPAQNFVNMALAILVSRAIQLDSFATVVGALSLLTLYDATSVFLIPAAGASELLTVSNPHPDAVEGFLSSSSSLVLTSELSPTAGSSAMGSIAIQKLTSTTFTPGLLTTKIGNSLGGALGLGDAVFPSLLASFVRRFDESTTDGGKTTSLLVICMVGYLLGCVACEFAPLLSTSGLPALVFIIPFMLMSVLIGSVTTGQLQELIAYNPKESST